MDGRARLMTNSRGSMRRFASVFPPWNENAVQLDRREGHHMKNTIARHLLVTMTCFGASACYVGLDEEAHDADEDVTVADGDESFRLIDVRDDGFSARLLVDDEPIAIESHTAGLQTRIDVYGREHYASWVVDFGVGEGTGWIVGVALEDGDLDKWRGVSNGRAGEVIAALSAATGEMASSSFAHGDDDEPPPEPGLDPLLDGLRVATSMGSFVRSRIAEDLTAAVPPETQSSRVIDDFSSDSDPAADWNGLCLPEWKCSISVALGCGGFAQKTGWTWLTAAGCGWAFINGFGFLCTSSNYMEFWDGNCLRSASTSANHIHTIYCVGGGCGNCH
jgi:hypothetical protein